jgi:PmbA protein
MQLLDKAPELKNLAQDILQQAKARGATQAEVSLQLSAGFDVKVRLGEVDTVSFNRDQQITIEVYYGQRTGAASSSDLSADNIKAAVAMACDMAQVTQEDDCAGLLDPIYIARSYPDLDLHHPWSIGATDAIELAKECEDYARQFDKRITNSDGATLATTESYYVYANSHGFMGSCPSSRHSISCVVIAEHSHDMQRDFWYTSARDAKNLQTVKNVGEIAADKTIKRLNARRIKTTQAPVIFDASIAGSLIGHFLAAISGSNLYRESSFLCDHLNQQIFPSFVHIFEDPLIPGAMGSNPFDSEGMATYKKDFIKDGVLCSYLLSSYSARKLKLKPTGNADGVNNLFIDPHPHDLNALLKSMGRGLYVTELIGQGVNILTGDYSRGVAGFWVENGIIQYPVHEITIAGNLRDMFRNLVAIGNDVDRRGNILTGSILLDKMMIAGE